MCYFGEPTKPIHLLFYGVFCRACGVHSCPYTSIYHCARTALRIIHRISFSSRLASPKIHDGCHTPAPSMGQQPSARLSVRVQGWDSWPGTSSSPDPISRFVSFLPFLCFTRRRGSTSQFGMSIGSKQLMFLDAPCFHLWLMIRCSQE